MRINLRAGRTFLGTDAKSVLEHSTITINDGKIESVSQSASNKIGEGAVDFEYDAENYFLMPGLADLHVHLSASGEPNYVSSALLTPSDYVTLRAQSQAAKTLDAGLYSRNKGADREWNPRRPKTSNSRAWRRDA